MCQGVPALAYGNSLSEQLICCSDICATSPRTSDWLSARLPNRLRGTVRRTGEIILSSCGESTLKQHLTGVAVDGCCGVLWTTTCNGC